MLWGFFRPSAIGVFEPDRERGAETRIVSRGAREKNKREINFVRSPTFFFSALRSERTNERSKNVGRTTTTTKTDWKTSREGSGDGGTAESHRIETDERAFDKTGNFTGEKNAGFYGFFFLFHRVAVRRYFRPKRGGKKKRYQGSTRRRLRVLFQKRFSSS